MKKKILIGLGALIFCTVLIFNVSIAKDNNNLVLNKMGSIAVAYDEDISEGGTGGSGQKYSAYTNFIKAYPNPYEDPYEILYCPIKRLVDYDAKKTVQTCYDFFVYEWSGYVICYY